MSDRKMVDAKGAPDAIGPYNHAVVSGGLVFCSGQVPLDPDSGEMVGETAAEQAVQCLKNLAAVCEAAGTELGNAVRMTIFTTQLDRFAEINDAYADFFPSDPPARAAVGVAALPKGAIVEIDAVVAAG
jgi:2-iminobutanoate/2-iminopropanoate deaminase